jgi:hypothetical protein
MKDLFMDIGICRGMNLTGIKDSKTNVSISVTGIKDSKTNVSISVPGNRN